MSSSGGQQTGGEEKAQEAVHKNKGKAVVRFSEGLVCLRFNRSLITRNIIQSQLPELTCHLTMPRLRFTS